MSGTVGRRGLEHRRLDAAVAMAYGYLNASRGARRMKLGTDEIASRRRQALDFATAALTEAMHWHNEQIATAAVKLAVEVYLDEGHENEVHEMFAELLERWGLDEFQAAVERPYTLEQLEDLAAGLEQLGEIALTGRSRQAATR